MLKLAISTVTLGALTALAAAQPAAPADKKAPAAPPAADKKAAVAVPAADKPATPMAPEVPAELTTLAKQMGGTWKCTGQGEIAGATMEVKATITHKVDANLNKFWIQSSFTGKAGKMPPLKFVMYTTYEPTAGKLWRVSVNARGGRATGTGTIAGNKISWEGEARWPGGVDVKTRMTEEIVSPKEVKVAGEYSKDGGKTWSKDHEATCKK